MKSLLIEIVLNGCDEDHLPTSRLIEAEKQMEAELAAILQKSEFGLGTVAISTEPEKRWGVDVTIISAASEREIRGAIGAERIIAAIEGVLKPMYALAYGDMRIGVKEIAFAKIGLDEFSNKLLDEFKKHTVKDIPLAPGVKLGDILRNLLYLNSDERRMVLYKAVLLAKERGADAIFDVDIESALAELQVFKKGGVEDKGNYIEQLSNQFLPLDSQCSFDRLIITEKARQEIDLALVTINPETFRKYKNWGLMSLDGHPRSVLNFYGPPGTGKTMAAHAIAQKFGKKIIIANCHSLQSKWHGESSKNVKAVFFAAERHDAILFFDEADSLISQRLEEVRSGSEDEINNMRNTILTCLEEHEGIVIFASNFVKRYDFAFETRIQSVLFPLPDVDMLEKIWKVHLPSDLPGVVCVDSRKLAEATVDFGFCGRDVKNAVLRACKVAIAAGKNGLTHEDLIASSKYIFDSRTELKENSNVIQKRPDKTENTPKSLQELVKEHTDEFSVRFLSGVPLADGFDNRGVAHKLLYFSEKEIRQIVSDACYDAQEAGEEKISTEIIERTIAAYRPKKEKEEAYDTLLEAVQAVIDRKVNK